MKDLATLQFNCTSAWTDYKVKTESLLGTKTVDSICLLTRGEFQKLYYHLAGVDERQQSIIFRCSVRSINEVIKRALRKYSQSETTRNYFTTPFANDARQAQPVPLAKALKPPLVEEPQEPQEQESQVQESQEFSEAPPSEPSESPVSQLDPLEQYPALILRKHGFRLRN